MGRKTDIEIIRGHECKIDGMWRSGETASFRKIFEYMKTHNLASSFAPWTWDKKRIFCTRCGEDKVYSITLGKQVFTLEQCTSAVRRYKSTPPFISMKESLQK